MNGIDISKWQKGISLASVPCDFVIIKATQNTSYISSEFENQITEALTLNKCVGVYHYAGGGGVKKEADHFLNTVKNYIGKAILVLDWEGYQNSAFSDYRYAEEWLEYVKNKTGITPFIYMSKSVCRQYKWERGCQYPLWVAQYANYDPTGYKDKPWTDNKGYGPWIAPAIFQYTSSGALPGYTDELDLNKSYINQLEWEAFTGGQIQQEPAEMIKPVLKYGDRNEYVRSWQRLLNANGFNCGKTDGIFGDKTKEAVIRWQQAHGMEAGYIGPKTWDTI